MEEIYCSRLNANTLNLIPIRYFNNELKRKKKCSPLYEALHLQEKEELSFHVWLHRLQLFQSWRVEEQCVSLALHTLVL